MKFVVLLQWLFVFIGSVVGYNEGNITIVCSPREVQALYDFYIAANGNFWDWKYPESTYGKVWNFSNINSSAINPCDDWQGLICAFDSHDEDDVVNDNEIITGYIESISLETYNLTGSISSSLAKLSNLSYLVLEENKLSGTIPVELCNNSNLFVLDLQQNYLSGTIHKCLIQHLPSLQILYLDNNLFSGKLPEFHEHSDDVSNLFSLTLSHNFLTGTIPSSIAYLNNTIEELKLSYNYFTGGFDSLMSLVYLTYLDLAKNSLSSTIPNAINALSSLEYVFIHRNDLYGTIPESLTRLSSLIYWNSFSNSFTGSIPNDIGNLRKIKRFAISENYLHGPIPDSVVNMTAVQEFSVYACYISGTLPSGFSQLKNLNTLLVQQNLMTGPLYPAFNKSVQTKLNTAILASNRFTGTIPTEVFGPRLTTLAIYRTCLSGSIPDDLCLSKSLRVLVLDGLTAHCAKRMWPNIKKSPKYSARVPGHIPACLWSLENITSIQISGNGLTGTIPELSDYRNLEIVDLSHNSLSGTIPYALQSKSDLVYFDLRSNRFIGTINGIGALRYSNNDDDTVVIVDSNKVITNGVRLKLSSNRLSGSIPDPVEDAKHIDILSGNIFACRNDHLPPKSDPYYSNYVCGSDILDISQFLSLATIATILVILSLLALLFHKLYQYYNSSLQQRESIEISMQTFQHSSEIEKTRSSHQDIANNTPRRTSSNSSTWSRSESMLSWHTIQTIYKNIFDFHELQKLLAMKSNELSDLEKNHPNQFFIGKKNLFATILIIKLLMWRAKLMQVYQINERCKQSAEAISAEKHYFGSLEQFLDSLRVLRVVAVIVMIYNLLVNLILYRVLKLYYKTYDEQYSWLLSAAYLSGYSPASIIICSWMLLISIVALTIAWKVPTAEQHEEILRQIRQFLSLAADDQQHCHENVTEKRQHHSRNTLQERETVVANPILERESQLRMTSVQKYVAEREEGDYDDDVTAPRMHEFSSIVGTPSIYCEHVDERSGAERRGVISTVSNQLERLREYCARPSLWISVAAFSLNVFVVLLIKSALIYLIYFADSNFQVKITFGVLLSAFDALWGSIVVPYIINLLPRKRATGRMILKLFVLFFNSIIAPCLAVAVTEDACFLGIFKRADTVTLSFRVNYCLYYNRYDSSKCAQLSSFGIAQKYTPTFVYNYNCYSAIISSYTPIIIFTFILLCLLLPSLSLFFLTKYGSQMTLHRLLPDVFYVKSDEKEISLPMTTEQSVAMKDTKDEIKQQQPEKPKRNRLFFPGFIIASALHGIIVQLTFGFTFPPLSIACCLLIIMTTSTWEVIIGRYVYLKETELIDDPVNGKKPPLKLLDECCVRVCCSPRKGLRLLTFGSATFVGLVTFDISGDAIGWRNSFWAPGATLFYATLLTMYAERQSIRQYIEYYQQETSRMSALFLDWSTGLTAREVTPAEDSIATSHTVEETSESTTKKLHVDTVHV